MSQLPVTITGHLVADPHMTQVYNGNLKTTMRVASSRRRRNPDPEGPEWIDTDNLFIDVEMWGALAQNVRTTLRKGMAVIVLGSLNTIGWKDEEGRNRAKIEVRANQVSLELSHYVATGLKIGADATVTGIPVPNFEHTGPDKILSRGENKESGNTGDAQNTGADTSVDTAADAQAAAASESPEPAAPF
ncbi:single-stranded DNA-binding protein [Corynebacterium sp. SA-MJD20WY100]|uniref:single-stranded DNA-binding protein n=1 Tax=Corynebacterium sp. SA-MJD20WY100 TaxID=3142969 RepID=UPI0032216E9C